MDFRIDFARSADEHLSALEIDQPKKYQKILKTLALLANNPRHPGLSSHRYENYDRTFGEKIWESYVENKTPSAHRIFWHYGPDNGEITIVAITQHP